LIRRLALCLLLVASPLVAADSKGRGYTARPCGFDWDQDGTEGEVTGDCNIVCRDSTGTGPQTSDLDSDGDNEEEYYVDCDTGSNSDTGGPEDPFLTLAYALSQADGVGDSAEDIICFTGTCPNTDVSLTPPEGDSAEGYWTKTATGNQVRDFRYPQDPGGIFGWDTDADGEYPPYDTDDTSIMDGTSLIKNFHNFEMEVDYFQLGHFSIDKFAYHNAEYGTDTNLFHGTGADPTYFRIHDIEIDSWNEGGCADGDTRMIDNSMGAIYGAWENVEFNDVQGKFMRGSANYAVVQGPVRLQHLTVALMGPYDAAADTACAGDGDDNVTLARSWGTATGYEILDSRFINQIGEYYSEGLSAAKGHGISQCMQDWDIINNYYLEFAELVAIDAGDSFTCKVDQNGRITKDVNVERNEWYYTMPDLGSNGPTAITVQNQDCYDTNAFDGSLRVVNNMFTTTSGGYFKYLALMNLGSTTDVSTATGETLIANNTVNVENKSYPNGGIITITKGGCDTYYDHDIRIYNNIINGLESGERAMWLPAWGGTMEIDYNVYESIANNGFQYDGTKYHTLAAWQAATTFGDNSDDCAPTFITSSDFHLDTSDTCAQEAGVSMASDFTDDFDGDARPQGSLWDIGADEYESGYNPPDGACCTGVSCAITTEANCAGGVWQGADTICSPNPCSVEDPPLGGELAGVTLSGVTKQ